MVLYSVSRVIIKDKFEPLLEVTQGISQEFTQALESSYRKAYSDIVNEEGLKKFGQGWYVDETFALAYFCILRYPSDYKKAVQTVVNITGDWGSVTSVVGGILGARLGVDAVPILWIEVLKEKEKLEEMVELLLEKYFQLSGSKLRS